LTSENADPLQDAVQAATRLVFHLADLARIKIRLGAVAA
jgi:hypothetical protein